MANKHKNTTILGIDPGYDRMGWGIINSEGSSFQYVAAGCVQTSSKNQMFTRYQQVQKELEDIIDKYQPSELAIESLFFFKNKKTALKVSESRGIIIGKCLDYQLSVHEYTPLQIKQAVTGYGRADKQSVEKMVRLQLNVNTSKNNTSHATNRNLESDEQTTKIKLIDDAIDALAVAMTHGTSRIVLNKI